MSLFHVVRGGVGPRRRTRRRGALRRRRGPPRHQPGALRAEGPCQNFSRAISTEIEPKMFAKLGIALETATTFGFSTFKLPLERSPHRTQRGSRRGRRSRHAGRGARHPPDAARAAQRVGAHCHRRLDHGGPTPPLKIDHFCRSKFDLEPLKMNLSILLHFWNTVWKPRKAHAQSVTRGGKQCSILLHRSKLV